MPTCAWSLPGREQVGVTVYRVRSQEPSGPIAGKRQRVSDSPFENLELILQVPRVCTASWPRQ